jgi:hypothetical protein
MTVQSWIDETRDLLLTDYVEELATLDADGLDASETVVGFESPSQVVPGVVAGATIEVGTELMYVFSVAASPSGAATVMRGYKGSTAQAHAARSLVTVNPKFPAYQVLDALNHELSDMSSPQNSLFQMKTVDFTFNAAQDGYNLTGVTDDILSIYQVTYSDPGSEASEPTIPSYTLRRNRDTDTFASGYALILHGDAWPGQTVRVMYKTGFTAATSASTALSTIGLHSSAYDVPVIGAALRMMASRPIRREFLDEQGSSRRSEEVPPGAVSASMRDLRALRMERMNAEASRLAGQYPTIWTRSGGYANAAMYRGV